MAIVEERVSIWRRVGAWLMRPAGQPDRPDFGSDEPSTRLDGIQDTDDGALADAAALGDPSLLRGFAPSVTRGYRSDSGHLWVEHLLVCGQCLGGDMFSIISFPDIAPGSSPYEDEGPGEAARLKPWITQCIQCGHRTTLVEAGVGDPQHRLDAPHIEGREPEDLFNETGAATVYVSLIYPEALDDLMTAATKVGVPPADLFDAIHILGVSPHSETLFQEVHEVASEAGATI